MQWSDEILTKAKEMFESGLYSCRQIGDVIGKSRNAVIGIARRRKWINPNPMKGGNIERKPRTFHRRVGCIISVVSTPAFEAEPLPKQPDFLGVGLMELDNNCCRFPDDSEPYVFCGQPAIEHSSYCKYHHRISYFPITPQKRTIGKTW